MPPLIDDPQLGLPPPLRGGSAPGTLSFPAGHLWLYGFGRDRQAAKALDPLDPIEWNAPLGANWLAFNRRSRWGFTIPWQFPKPRPAGSKSVPDRLYAKRALFAFLNGFAVLMR
jgi:hypothetical protein